MECKDVEQAAARLQGQIHNVKVTSSRTFSEMSSCQLFLKCENRQKTGSFKVRGAFNKLAKLKEEGKTSEVIASSAGNHAQGVSYAASKLGHACDHRDAEEHTDRQGAGNQGLWCRCGAGRG